MTLTRAPPYAHSTQHNETTRLEDSSHSTPRLDSIRRLVDLTRLDSMTRYLTHHIPKKILGSPSHSICTCIQHVHEMYSSIFFFYLVLPWWPLFPFLYIQLLLDHGRDDVRDSSIHKTPKLKLHNGCDKEYLGHHCLYHGRDGDGDDLMNFIFFKFSLSRQGCNRIGRNRVLNPPYPLKSLQG